MRLYVEHASSSLLFGRGFVPVAYRNRAGCFATGNDCQDRAVNAGLAAASHKDTAGETR